MNYLKNIFSPFLVVFITLSVENNINNHSFSIFFLSQKFIVQLIFFILPMILPVILSFSSILWWVWFSTVDCNAFLSCGDLGNVKLVYSEISSHNAIVSLSQLFAKLFDMLVSCLVEGKILKLFGWYHLPYRFWRINNVEDVQTSIAEFFRHCQETTEFVWFVCHTLSQTRYLHSNYHTFLVEMSQLKY